MKIMPKDPILTEIHRLTAELRSYPATSEEYQTIAARIGELGTAYSKANAGLSTEAKVKIGCYLAGLVLVLGFEQGHVIGSKAFTMITKL